MATALLSAGPACPATMSTGTATLVLVLSPVRAATGQLHTLRQPIPAGQCLRTYLPPRQAWQRILCNGGVVPEDAWDTWPVTPGDEVWLIPRFGYAAIPFLIYAAVAIAVSVAATALTYVLFPPSRPHMTPPDEHTFSFAGIQTAIGPGGVVPVIYGRHRVGGQLLAAFVEQALTVVDTASGTTRLQAISDPPRLHMLLAFSEGPIANHAWETLEINGQPAANFPGVELDHRLGTPDQTAMGFFTETRNTFADGRSLPDNSANTGQQIVYTTTEPVTAFILNIVFNEGLFNVNGKGEKEENTVTVTYAYKGTGFTEWSPWHVFDIAAQRTAPVRVGIRREGLPLAQHDIALNFGNPRHSDELHAKFKPTLESVTEVQDGTQTYPNTSVLGLRAVATDQLQGALPNITVEVAGRLVRVGSFTATPSWSDNPAWCVMDFLTSQRYGLGVPDSEIDLYAFAQWAAYCDETTPGERRHTFNYVLDRDQRAQGILLEMMGGSRTLLVKSGGLWTPRPTRNDPPVQLLSATTCSNLRITYTRDPDRINVMEARYANEQDGYEQDVMTWPTVDQWPAEVHKASLDIRGVTTPSRIQRALQFELNRRHYENVTLEFDNALDATTLLVHDLFRFSHPLPGWGASGRIMEGSTSAILYLDGPVTMSAGITYHCYLRFPDDTTEVRVVVNPGDTTTTRISVFLAYSQTPVPRDTVWAFGQEAPEGAMRIFRAVQVQRKNDTTVHIQAVIHNPTIYDDPVASPLPVPPGLFNPLGPPPPLTFLLATELVRIQPSGIGLTVVNLAWDVAGLGAGYAPYGGAIVYRRAVLDAALAGQASAGAIDLGAIQNPNDNNVNYNQITQVTGHVLEVDDFTVVTGATYVYRVVPVSGRGVPNNVGAREALIHVAGGTTGDYFPGTVQNLRLRGQAVGDLLWEGRDVHLQWDPVPDSGLFSSTFFVQDYIVQVWAPGQEYLLRSTATPQLEFTYTFDQNTEDQIHAGKGTARRDLAFYVFARTNTGRLSLEPAHITVTNPPPDMSNLVPEAYGFAGGIISWQQFVEPRDFDHYEVHLDTVTPPVAIYQSIATSFSGQGRSQQQIYVPDLVIGTTYYTSITPYDTFGPGLASQIAAFVAAGVTAESIDSTPPGKVTNLTLTQGRDVSADGTIMPWVEASWTPPADQDVRNYQVQVFVVPSTVPTVWLPNAGQTTIRFPVPGHVTIRVRVFAADNFQNFGEWSDEATITTDGDTTPPAAPLNLIATGSIRSIALLWTPPSDLDYDYSQVWAATTNNRAVAVQVGTGKHSFVHEGLGANDQRWYWLRARDTSGNLSTNFFPTSATAGVTGTAGQLDSTYISSLVADKITAGTIQALVRLGTPQIELDNLAPGIRIYDLNNIIRLAMGKLGPLSSDWGMRMWRANGQLMWNFTEGVLTDGISDAAITAPKIRAGTIEAGHLTTQFAVITTAAQIATAVINDGHIVNLNVDKLLTGTVGSFWYIGVGHRMTLDGVNENMLITDQNGTWRVWIGKLGPNIQDYGMRIYNQFGQLMWDPLSGAMNAGITDTAVTTPKVQYNAITGSLLTVNTGGDLQPNADTEVARLTFPEIHNGDQIWVTGMCTAWYAGYGGVTSYAKLLHDGLGGYLAHLSQASEEPGSPGTKIPLSVQTVWYPGADQFNKVFVLAAGGGRVSDVVMTGLRLQR